MAAVYLGNLESVARCFTSFTAEAGIHPVYDELLYWAMRQHAAVNVITPFLLPFMDYKWQALIESLRAARRGFVVSRLNRSDLL